MTYQIFVRWYRACEQSGSGWNFRSPLTPLSVTPAHRPAPAPRPCRILFKSHSAPFSAPALLTCSVSEPRCWLWYIDCAVPKGSKRHFYFFLQERQKTDYNQLLVTLMFGKITKYSAPNCPFTKLSCFYRQDLPQAALLVFRLLTGRFWGFSPRRGDTLHRSRSNLAGRSGP